MTNFFPPNAIRISGLSKVLGGPLCVKYLDADVVKVERVELGDGTRSWPPLAGNDGTIFLSVNRNKSSLVIDLKTSADSELIHRTVRTADVVIESFGPGAAERLLLNCERLASRMARTAY